MIEVEQVGSFDKTLGWLNLIQRIEMRSVLERHAQDGVDALSAATPVGTGVTANSWEYKIDISRNAITIEWYNTNENDGVPIALILQYGHGTGTGGYVQGIDYINPAMKPIFDNIANDVFKELGE